MRYNLLITLYVLMYSICSASMEQDPRYAEALKYKNQEMPDVSKEESTRRAESLFETIANEGNVKAMHNYALIQYNKENYELAYKWFNEAGQKGLEPSARNAEKMLKEGQAKKELHLVVGSTRDTSGRGFGPIIDNIYGYKTTDVSHLQTFNGKATTLDLAPCAIKGAQHIVGDVRTYDFSKYIISSVLFERLPTIIDSSSPEFESLSNDVNHLTQNFIGAAIINILRSMKTGGRIEIEWLPYNSLIVEGLDELEKYIQANPFHCFLNLNVMLQSIFILGKDKENVKILPSNLVKPTLDMVEKVRSQLEFYHQQGAGQSIEELISLLYFEARIILEMTKNESQVLLDYNVREQNIDKLKQAYEKAEYAVFPAELIGQKVLIPNGSAPLKGFVYNQPKFMEGSFYNFLVDDIAAEYNRSYAIKYLESLGLEDISIEKGVNPHNGRKNVWMIKAKKP